MSAVASRVGASGPAGEMPVPSRSPWAVALTVVLATFMEVLDTSIVNVALDHIAGNLSASRNESTWIVTSYLVSNAIVLPLSGWLSSWLGRKRYYLISVVVFTASSLLCGLAQTLGALVFFRVLQGIGGGGLQPVSQAILADSFPREKRGMAFAVFGMAVVLAPMIGPTLGGWITDHYAWQWLFFINIPVGILSVLLTTRIVSDPPYLVEQRASLRRRGFRIDTIGLGLVVLGLGALQIMLDKGEEDGWFESTFIQYCFWTSAVSLVLFVLWELRHKEPIVDLRLLGERSFGASTFMMLVLGAGLYSSTILLPMFVQGILGYSATDAGLVISPGGLVVLLLMPMVGMLLSKVQARWLLLFGFLLNGLAVLHMSGFNGGIDRGTAIWARVYQSVGIAFLFAPINVAAYASVPQSKNNQASGIINLARNIGGSVGIALAVTMLSRRAQLHQANLVSHLTPYDSPYQAALAGASAALGSSDPAAPEAQALLYGALQRQTAIQGFVDAFWLIGILLIAVVPLVFLVKDNQPGKRAVAAH
jgi:DHA2 family multidrug resistance protein